MKKLLFSTIMLLSASDGFSATDYQLENVQFFGTGCQRNNTTMDVSTDGQAITALFSNYIAESGARLRRNIDRKDCKITFDVKLRPGYQMSVISVDHAGYADIPRGSSGEVKTEFFIPGEEKLELKRSFNGPSQGDFILSQSASTTYWSKCGGKEVFQINSRIYTRTGSSNETAYLAMDSVDAEAGVQYNLRVRRCPDVDERLTRLYTFLSDYNRDLFASTGEAPWSYIYQGSLGQIWLDYKAGRHALYNCEGYNVEGFVDRYSDLSCGSDRRSSLIGYIDANPGFDKKPIYACESHYGNGFLADSEYCNGNSPYWGELIGYIKK